MGYWPYWSIKAEIQFIDGLGRHCNESQQLTLQERYNLLTLYKEGLQHRKVWDDLKPEEVMGYVNHKLKLFRTLLTEKEKTK